MAPPPRHDRRPPLGTDVGWRAARSWGFPVWPGLLSRARGSQKGPSLGNHRCHVAVRLEGGSRSASSSTRRRAGSAARSEPASRGPSFSMRTSKTDAPFRRRESWCFRPAVVRATRTTRPSPGSTCLSANPSLSSSLTREDIEGCVTPSLAARSVKRRAPVRSIVPSVDRAVRLKSRCLRRMLSVANANSTSPIEWPSSLPVGRPSSLIPLNIGESI